jgi:flagellar protein FlaJ
MSLDRGDGGTEPSAVDGLSIEALFYPVYRRLFDEDSDFVDDIERKLSQARMSSNVEMYLSRAVGVGLVTGLALWLFGTFVGFLVSQLLGTGPVLGIPLPETLSTVIEIIRTPLILMTTGLIFGAVGFLAGFGGFALLPYIRSTGREREINTLLPDTIAFMYALSVGGMNQLEIVRATARADDTYGEVAKEFQSIILETEYFDTDYRTAVQNQAVETPSDELGQFLTDMLSILDSGGDMTKFLEDQKDKHIRTAKQEQEKQLETLELFGEMYMTLSLFPLLLIIILVIMTMMGGGGSATMLYMTVYGLIPMIGFAFLVMVSTVTQDEFGDGYLRPAANEEFDVNDGINLFGTGLVQRYTGRHGVFDQIKKREGRHEFRKMLSAPHLFFRDHPVLVLGVTVPLTLLLLGAAIVTGAAPMSIAALQNRIIWGTFLWIYMPIYVNLLPLAIFHSWNIRSRRAVLGNLSENQDDIDRERRARTRMQIVIIIMTYLTLLAVMALLQVQFLDAMTAIADEQADSGGAAGEFIGNLDAGFLSMLFFHAVTIQAVISAVVAGYIRNVDLVSGAKYAVFLSTIALITWVFVERAVSGGGSAPEAGLLLLGGSVRDRVDLPDIDVLSDDT